MTTLSKKQLELYNQLINLCSESENFFFVDQVTPMQTPVRIFNYRLAGYSDWLKPGALECRGIMFQMDATGPVKLLSRPMEKFFNYAEVKAWEALKTSPVTIGETINNVMIKEDGSLISTFDDSGYLGVKSKGSVGSDQAMSALVVIHSSPGLGQRLHQLALSGYTVNMEYVAPTNRIVIGYENPAVIILNIRHNETGEYIPNNEIFKDPVLRPFLVKNEAVIFDNLDEFVSDVYDMEGFEGYVVQTDTGFFKIKTNWYVNLHRTKDSINNNKDLFINIAENTVDDLKQLFIDDVVALKKIDAFETLFLECLNRLTSKAYAAIETLKGKSRKDYAVALSSDMSSDGRLIFGPLMRYFDDTDKQKLVDNIVSLMVKNYDQFIPEYYK